jgi:hypothetical protein
MTTRKPRDKTADSAATPNFSDLLQSLVDRTSGETVTLGQLLDVVGRRSFGPVILLLGLVGISPLTVVPGATWAVATVTLAFAVQILFNLKHPLMPGGLLNLSLPRNQLVKLVAAGGKAAHIADKLTAPRLTFLTAPPFVTVTALACIGSALVTYPLGLVPLGPVLPGLSIVLLGIGMTARDGVFLGLSLLTLAGSALLVWKAFG